MRVGAAIVAAKDALPHGAMLESCGAMCRTLEMRRLPNSKRG